MTATGEACESNKLNCADIVAKSYEYALFDDIHLALPQPDDGQGETFYTRGQFKYFHYGCDGTNDAGWGCGYRTLQTAISWIINKRSGNEAEHQPYVPSILEIQRMLVNIGDKPKRFIGSRDWIGTLEECYVIDAMFELPCKIVNVPQLNDEQVIAQISSYFKEYAGFIAMGGLSDTASKGIAGIKLGTTGVYLLIVDPHYTGVPSERQQVFDQSYVRWMHVKEFPAGAYNLCFILQK